jgi:hypothetical protein
MPAPVAEPALVEIAFWMRTMVAPSLVDVANGPWQPAQFAVYKPAPSVGGADAVSGIGSDGLDVGMMAGQAARSALSVRSPSGFYQP